MLDVAGVVPESLKTWDGYITAAKKLNSALNAKGIQGVHLIGANHSLDLLYPYLWMPSNQRYLTLPTPETAKA